MSTANPSFGLIPRQSIAGMEGMYVKMWDPPTESPETPDLIAATNPVPEVMAAAGYQDNPSTPHTVMRDLLHGGRLTAWDGKELNFMLLRDHDNPATGDGNFPGATIRVPRGVIFHAESQGHGPPPHTIHWHGVEPTPMNDGVGHCSMEIGHYTYQFQPNFMGFYFAHCHRNTVQHFEFGLYMALIVDAADAYFATQWNRAIPIGAGRDGKRRVAANLNKIGTVSGVMNAGSGAGFETITIRDDAAVQALWPGYVGGSLKDPDTEAGNYPGFPVTFATNPHAVTVPFDVEALWVVDDRDSRWSDLAPNARATYPQHGNVPGTDDNFHGNAGGGLGAGDFFAFNDFNPDYWYVTGVNFPGTRVLNTDGTPHLDAHGVQGTGSGTIPADIEIPPELMSGVSGVQVPINANVGQTILVRALDAAYNNVTYRFPVDVTIIGWDGRGLGATSQTQFNHAYTVPAGTPIHASVARRFDALIRTNTPVSGFAEVDFTDTRCGTANGFERPVLFTGRIPINIGYGISGRVTNGPTFGLRGATVTIATAPGGAVVKTTTTDARGNYSVAGLAADSYTVTPTLAGFTFVPVAPATGNVTISNASVVDQNFTATQAADAFTISGIMFESRGGAAIGASPGAQANPVATVNLSGPVNLAIAPDSQGSFLFTGLPNGEYIVTPVSAAFNFQPPSRTVTIQNANRSVVFRGRRVPVAGL